jgi:hypothetical protein
MNEIDEIRLLLTSVEARLFTENDVEQVALRNLDALEFPELVAAVIDFLQPILEPYEAAIYCSRRWDAVCASKYARTSVRGDHV